MDPIVKNFDRPDQRPELPKGSAALVHLGDQTVVRGRLEPGWRWSNDWRPLMGTPSCKIHHTGYVLAGRAHFEMDDGTTVDVGPGDVYSIPPGHDAWVVGDEAWQTFDWSPASNEAREQAIEVGTKNAAH